MGKRGSPEQGSSKFKETNIMSKVNQKGWSKADKKRFEKAKAACMQCEACDKKRQVNGDGLCKTCMTKFYISCYFN